MLVTIGVTVLAYNKDKKKITHNFRPLVYMFVKQHESEESISFLCTALQAVSILYSGGPLDPGVSACICMHLYCIEYVCGKYPYPRYHIGSIVYHFVSALYLYSYLAHSMSIDCVSHLYPIWRPFGSRCIHMYLHVSVLYRVCMRQVSISQILYRLHCVSFRICRVSTLVSCALYEYPLDDRCCYFRPLGRHSVRKYLRDGISWI